ncbi:hypothetical protein [Metabacillus schmidteae]|uniref:hypothetical protein n=1 Tax=Metabacillus schmidteae TaxID=2730405 RepID=UPI0038B358CD
MDTCARPSDATRLNKLSFDLPRFSVTIPEEVSKTRKARTLPILPHTSEVLKKLLRVRPHDWDEDVPVFCNS